MDQTVDFMKTLCSIRFRIIWKTKLILLHLLSWTCPNTTYASSIGKSRLFKDYGFAARNLKSKADIELPKPESVREFIFYLILDTMDEPRFYYGHSFDGQIILLFTFILTLIAQLVYVADMIQSLHRSETLHDIIQVSSWRIFHIVQESREKPLDLARIILGY